MFLLKPKVILLLAVVSGALAFYGFSRYMKQQEENLRKSQVVKIPVVVASNDLSLGTSLTSTDLQIREWPENIVSRGSFRDIPDVEGRVLQTDVAAGEAILESKLAPKGSSGGLSSLIPPGMRAISVAVNVVSGVSGFILPKTWVDVLATIAPSSEKNKTFTKTILENVQVLAIDQTYRKNGDDPVTVQSVTLLVTPDEAEKLALAANEGKLQLTLRSTADSDLIETDGVLVSHLLYGKPKPRPRVRRVRRPSPPPKKEQEPAPRVVEVIRSNVRTEVTFEEGKAEEKKANGTAAKP